MERRLELSNKVVGVLRQIGTKNTHPEKTLVEPRFKHHPIDIALNVM